MKIHKIHNFISLLEVAFFRQPFNEHNGKQNLYFWLQTAAEHRNLLEPAKGNRTRQPKALKSSDLLFRCHFVSVVQSAIWQLDTSATYFISFGLVMKSFKYTFSLSWCFKVYCNKPMTLPSPALTDFCRSLHGFPSDSHSHYDISSVNIKQPGYYVYKVVLSNLINRVNQTQDLDKNQHSHYYFYWHLYCLFVLSA